MSKVSNKQWMDACAALGYHLGTACDALRKHKWSKAEKHLLAHFDAVERGVLWSFLVDEKRESPVLGNINGSIVYGTVDQEAWKEIEWVCGRENHDAIAFIMDGEPRRALNLVAHVLEASS